MKIMNMDARLLYLRACLGAVLEAMLLAVFGGVSNAGGDALGSSMCADLATRGSAISFFTSARTA
jgi:hypothetical protein